MTGFAVQVVVDCDDPHMLADWWAETLRWTVEPQDESFIRSMIDQGHATEAETRLHKGALVWRDPGTPETERRAPLALLPYD